MSTPQYVDVSDVPRSHNASAQHNVIKSDDPALDMSHEHSHARLHHDKHAAEGRKEDVVYSEGATFDKSAIPHQDPQDHDLARRRHADKGKKETDVNDTEKGSMSPDRLDEGDARTHTYSTFYAKYRIYAHLVIWLFFTGFVS